MSSDGYGFTSIRSPPRWYTSSGNCAAGYTVAEVPATIMQSARAASSKHPSSTSGGIGSPNDTVSLFSSPPQRGQLGGRIEKSIASLRKRSTHPRQRISVALPWISSRRRLPASRCRLSTFCVISARSTPRSSSSASARCPGFGFASPSASHSSRIGPVGLRRSSHARRGLARKRWKPFIGGSPCLVQSPSGPRNGGIPLSTDSPAPVSATT